MQAVRDHSEEADNKIENRGQRNVVSENRKETHRIKSMGIGELGRTVVVTFKFCLCSVIFLLFLQVMSC